MSAKMMMSQPEADQGFGLLKDIVDMVKNPDAIDEAYERRRKAAELTDDEVASANSARALIAQADSIRSEFQQREDALNASIDEHEKNIGIFNNRVQSENTRLAEIEAKLNDIASAQESAQIKLSEDRKKIETDIAEAKSIADLRNSKLDARERAIEEGESANSDEADRLADWEAKLKSKAAALAEIASS